MWKINKIKSLFVSSPSRFGKGIGLLWRGNSLEVINKFIFRLPKTNENKKDNFFDSEIFLFESARTAIYNCLVANMIGNGDEVIISSFTCDAVSDAVKRSGADVIYVDINDDLTMCDEDLLQALNHKTKAVIMQNTFGRLGLKESTIEKIRANKIFIIEDSALAIGSKIDGKSLGLFGDVSIWSLEVSKTVTIGWGGVLSVNNDKYREKIIKRYNEIGTIPFAQDIRRLFQLWLSVLLTNKRIPGSLLIWYFMYGTRMFRRSKDSSNNINSNYDKIGRLSRKLFFHMRPLFNHIFDKTHENYKLLELEAINLGLNIPIIEKEYEYIVTPRFSILVDNSCIFNLVIEAKKFGIEVGRWFKDVPPKVKNAIADIKSFYNAEKISYKIVNFPCHWTLDKHEIENILSFMKYLSHHQLKSIEN